MLDRLSMRVRTFDGAAFLPAEGESISPRSKVGDYVIEDRGYDTPCWIWQRGTDGAGYGKLSPGTAARDARAHREYWRLANGPIPKGAHIHHKCEQPPCVNPAHLEPKAHSQHLADHKQADSTLTWDDVRAIRAALTGGAGQYDLMDTYGIAQPTLSDIATNTTWVDPDYTPGRLADCVECGEAFIAVRCDQRFCCQLHCKRFNNRRRYREIKGIAA